MPVVDSIVRTGGAMVTRSDFDAMDRNADPALDELTEFTAVLSGADYAYIGWLDFSRLWFKSRFGFIAADQPRSSTACQYVVEAGKPLMIADAASDPRFLRPELNCPAASLAGRTLACRSIRQSTHHRHAGDSGPETEPVRQEHLTLLEVLGRQVVTRLELYNRIRAQEQAQRARQRTERALAIERCFVAATLDSIPALVAVLDTAGRMVRMNQPCAQLTGLSLADAVGRPFVEEVLEPDDRQWAAGSCARPPAGQVSGPHETAWRVGCGGHDAPRELDAAAAAGTERRDPVPDCERAGRDRPARRWKRRCSPARRATARWWRTAWALCLPARWKAG